MFIEISVALIPLNFVFLITYLIQKLQGLKKLYTVVLISIVLSFIAGVSIFKATIWYFYLPPLFGISIIIFAETIAAQKHLFLRALAVLWIILF